MEPNPAMSSNGVKAAQLAQSAANRRVLTHVDVGAVTGEKGSEGVTRGKAKERHHHSISYFSLVIYSICTGAIATVAGLVVSAAADARSPTKVWLTTTGVLVGISGIAAIPLLRFMGQRRKS